MAKVAQPNLILLQPPATAQYADGLTPRELEVARLATLTNRDIGLVLGISPKTVKVHLANITRKTRLEGRAAIAVWAERLSQRAA